MKLKKNLLKLTVPTLLIFTFFYILNFVTDKKDALANINNKQIVEVFKTPSCGCCYGYVLFLEKEKLNGKIIIKIFNIFIFCIIKFILS